MKLRDIFYAGIQQLKLFYANETYFSVAKPPPSATKKATVS